MDETKIQDLRRLHGELARYLGEQHETIEGMAIVIGALRQTIEGDPDLSGKYAAHYESLKSSESARPNPMQAGVLQGFLNRLRNW